MGRFLHVAWLVVPVAACGYDFAGGGGGDGASASSTTGDVTSDTASSADATTASPASATSTDTSSVVASSGDTTASASVASSSSTGSGPLVPCFADTFDDFEDPPWDSFGNVSSDASHVEMTGMTAGGLTRFRVDDCFISISFDAGSGANIYLDVRQSNLEVISISRFADDHVTFDVDNAEIASVPPAPGVDALALHFGSQRVTAFFRQGNTWTKVVPAIEPTPLWLDGESGMGEVGGFGIVNTSSQTAIFQDFSIATPPAP